MNRRALSAGILLTLLLWNSAKNTFAYAPVDGPFSTAVSRDVTLNDDLRHKTLKVTVCYPITDQGPFPVIIFSHGYGGSAAGYTALLKGWAAAGYIVIAPDHDDAGALRVSGGERPYQKMMQTLEKPANWQQRADDLRLCLDRLGEVEQRLPECNGKLSRQLIGVGGHSFGAETAMFLAGAKPVDQNGQPMEHLGDDRPQAFLILSCPGVTPGGGGFSTDSFKQCIRPILFMTGSNDLGRGGQDAQWRRGAYDGCPPGEKYFYFISGANHLSFTGIGFRRPGTEAADISSAIQQGSVAWWDARLKHSGSAVDALEHSDFTNIVHLEHR